MSRKAECSADELRAIGEAFEIPGEWRRAERLGRGHINDSYLAEFDVDGHVRRWVHQRINESVFPDPLAVMRNVETVTRHLRERLESGSAGRWEVLTLVPARAGGSWHRDPQGGVWRTYRHVERARTFETGHQPEIARAAARAFGRFVRELGGLDPGTVIETIPRFHDLRLRCARLFAAADEDRAGRAHGVRRDLDFVRARVGVADRLDRLRRDEGLPVRVVHNDTKVNNVLIDDETGEGVCVLDLDTVMPGTLLFDYGDLVRTATSRASEDAGDSAPVHVDLDLFEAVTDGYLEETSRLADPVEIENLLFGAGYMTLIIGVRFLTDHLEGDPYFRTTRPGQNLDRWRTQRRLLESLERHEEDLQALVLDLAHGR